MNSILILTNLLLSAAVFGYAFSATAVSYPAMMSCSRDTAVEYFYHFFHKSAKLMMILSVLVLIVCIALTLRTENWSWIIVAVILQLSGPYTVKILMPVNNRIMAEGADINSEQMTQDLGRWGRLHLPRTLLAGFVFICFGLLSIGVV